MGLKSQVDRIALERQTVAMRQPVAYAIGVGQVIFTIQGGPILITALFGHIVTGAIAGATTFNFFAGGVAIDAPTIITSINNQLIVSPLDDTAVTALAFATFRSNLPLDTLLASPGNITLTVGGANTVGAVAFYVVYYRLNPASEVI